MFRNQKINGTGKCWVGLQKNSFNSKLIGKYCQIIMWNDSVESVFEFSEGNNEIEGDWEERNKRKLMGRWKLILL